MDYLKYISKFLGEEKPLSPHFLELQPYNHWKWDTEWIVVVRDLRNDLFFCIPVIARTAGEATEKVLEICTGTHTEEED